ncbi:MAG: P-loop NTPase [Magnetococcales bacterium]|nr:P-loop NTPase [Magnetococcales bacterium]MBF0116149.1 P-loop NTPase [Magnetococcales bacterium]
MIFDHTLEATAQVFIAAKALLLELFKVEKQALLVNRDLNGRVSIIAHADLEADYQAQLAALSQQLAERLEKHAAKRPLLYDAEMASVAKGAVSFPLQLFVPEALQAELADLPIQVVDRLATESHWLPRDVERGGVPRIVFYSIKGGVGRSTALAVMAWDLAAKGRKVMVLDLDLESPGLSSALLPEERRPDYGIADWLVEDLVDNGERLLAGMSATSPLADASRGSIVVIPAHGRDPGEYIAKLGRVWMPKVSSQPGAPVRRETWSQRLARLINRLQERHQPQVILIDSRAGIDEVAASCLMDMGAQHILLFAIDGAQTWSGYRILFRHWRRSNTVAPIRARLHLVGAMVPELEPDDYMKRMQEQAAQLFTEELYDAIPAGEVMDGARYFGFVADDNMAPHAPIAVRWHRGWSALPALHDRLGAFHQREIDFVFGELKDFIARIVLPAQATAGPSNASAIRAALLAALPESYSNDTLPTVDNFYIFPMHAKALHLDVSLVSGVCGAGKSFLIAALADDTLKSRLAEWVPELHQTDICIGFSELVKGEFSLDSGLFSRLLDEGYESEEIWRAVIIRWLASFVGRDLPVDWLFILAWLRDNPEEVMQLVSTANHHFAGQYRHALIVFDTLDFVGAKQLDELKILQGLSQIALWFKEFPWLHVKVFLQFDQFRRDPLWGVDLFPLNLRANFWIPWDQSMLHGLLWQRLMGHADFLRAIRGTLGQSDGLHGDDQKIIRQFDLLAGTWAVDGGHNTAVSWLNTYLQDVQGWITPRSFLAAIRQAAIHTQEFYPDHPWPLHPVSIKNSIRQAAKVRVAEISSHYPWIIPVMEALKGVTLPCKFEQIQERWQECFPEGPGNMVEYIHHFREKEADWSDIRNELHISRILKLSASNDRIDFPEIYRVAFGLGRQGGVHPDPVQ